MGSKKKPARRHTGTRQAREGCHLIFRPFITDPKTGARRPPPPGRKAWAIWVKDDGPDQAKKE